MSEKPLNAETPTEYLRSWITPNSVFFKRNQGDIMKDPIALSDWELTFEGEVEKPHSFDFDQIIRLPKAIVANTLECSGNGRSLLEDKAAGNPWAIGGVGNAVWGGVWPFCSPDRDFAAASYFSLCSAARIANARSALSGANRNCLPADIAGTRPASRPRQLMRKHRPLLPPSQSRSPLAERRRPPRKSSAVSWMCSRTTTVHWPRSTR